MFKLIIKILIEDKFKNATPEQIIALKKAEQDYKLELKRLDTDLRAILDL
jgi:hypothetical protein